MGQDEVLKNGQNDSGKGVGVAVAWLIDHYLAVLVQNCFKGFKTLKLLILTNRAEHFKNIIALAHKTAKFFISTRMDKIVIDHPFDKVPNTSKDRPKN